jgi:hypothetical protein
MEEAKRMRRSWRLDCICLLGVVGSVLAVAPSAGADSTAPLYAKMKQRFTTERPGARTGWSFDGALKPYPAGAQVPPQRELRFVFPRGTRFRLRSVPNCAASDQQIIADGLAACPAGSRVGSGGATLFLGAAGLLKATAYVVAARPTVAIIFTTDSGTVLRVLRATVNRNRVAATLPAVQLPGGYELAITQVRVSLRRAGTRANPLIRTPKTCPRSGRWKFVYLPRYDDPYGVQRSTSTTPCHHQ